MTEPSRPILHLSGEKLRIALEQLIAAAELVGGIERFAGAVKLRAEIIRARVGDGRIVALGRPAFDEIAVLMPTVRRRIGPLIDMVGWPKLREAMTTLLHDAQIPGTADQRVRALEQVSTVSTTPSPPVGEGRGGGDSVTTEFVPRATLARSGMPPHPNPPPRRGEARGAGRRTESEPYLLDHRVRAAPPRFLRDLAAELLHAVYPEHYPLMTRWVWDAAANTGALREIWHDPVTGTDSVDHVIIDVADRHATFLVLREELSQFLSDNGVFRDMIWYVDLVLAHVYAIYINAQGGVYLKADFQADGDPLGHTRRILGLDKNAIGAA